MKSKEELEQYYRNDLEVMYKDRDELMRCLEKNRENRNEAVAEFDKLEAEKEERVKKFYDDLSDEGKKVLQLRYKFFKIAETRKKYAFLISVIYAIVVAGVFYFLNLGFSKTAIISYVVGAILIIPIYFISLKCLKKPWERKWWETYSNLNVVEYDKKIEEERKNTSNNKENLNRTIDECDAREKQIYEFLNEMKEREKNILLYLDELNFHYAYNHTVLFWGTEKWNYYEIYIDGHYYDTVRGKTIIPITLEKGLHSFKVTNTCLNFDKSVISSYTFNTKQFEIDENVLAYPVVVDGRNIEYPTGKRFQEITKQKLV